jgi:hypothetical protein
MYRVLLPNRNIDICGASNFDKHILFKHVKLVLLDMVSAVMHPPNKGFDKRGWRVQEVDPRQKGFRVSIRQILSASMMGGIPY